MTDAAAGLSVLHVIVRAGPTNSQYNEHCLPVLDTRTVTVCSLFPADVAPPDTLRLFEGDGSVGGCFRALRQALTSDDYDVVHVHAPASGVVTLLTYLRLHRSRRDLVFTVHNSWQSFRRRNRLFLRLIMLLFPLIVVCGQAAYESMPKRLRRVRQDKLQVVRNGVDVDRVDKALAGHERPVRTGFHVVAVSRLIPIKHPHTVFSAFTRMRKRDDTLTMIGDGALSMQLADRVQHEQLLKAVTLRGIIPRDEVYRELHAADAFVTTSAGEGLPVAMLEAMACGVPVVASDIAPHREIARVARGIPLVRVGDTDGFARALERLRSVGPDERARIGQRLRRSVEEHFSVTSMNEEYGRLYRARVPRGAEVGRSLRTATRLDPESAGLGDRLRQRLAFLCVMGLLGGVLGFGIAFVQAPVYKAETSLQVGRDLGLAPDEDTLKTSAALAAQYADLARREPVLGPLVRAGYAEEWRKLQADVYARVGDKNPQLVEISVYRGDREEAAALVTAIAASLQRASREASSGQSFLGGQLNALEQDITRTTRELDQVRALLVGADPDEAATLMARIQVLQAGLTELRSTYADLDALDTSAGGELRVVDGAWTTRSPLRPTPLVLALAGLAIGLTLAIGWVHLFDRRPPVPPVTAPTMASAETAPEPRLRRQHNGRARASAWAGGDSSWHDRDLERR